MTCGVELARQPCRVGDRGVEQPAAVGEVLFRGRAGGCLLPEFGLRLEASRVDVGVGLDGRVEIAVDGLGSLGLLQELFPERLGVRLQLG